MLKYVSIVLLGLKRLEATIQNYFSNAEKQFQHILNYG